MTLHIIKWGGEGIVTQVSCLNGIGEAAMVSIVEDTLITVSKALDSLGYSVDGKVLLDGPKGRASSAEISSESNGVVHDIAYCMDVMRFKVTPNLIGIPRKQYHPAIGGEPVFRVQLLTTSSRTIEHFEFPALDNMGDPDANIWRNSSLRSQLLTLEQSQRKILVDSGYPTDPPFLRNLAAQGHGNQWNKAANTIRMK